MKRLRPNSIKNVDPFIIETPFGIDMVVKGLQENHSNSLDWLEKSFGRAVYRTDIREDSQEYVYPAMFVCEGYDFLDMLQLDNYDAYSFFIARDPENTVEFEEGIRNTYQRTLSNIFWMNLERIDQSRQDDFLEQLKEQVLRSIKNARFPESTNNGQVLGIEVTSIYDEPKNIFDGFSLDVTDSQFLYYPYRGLRIDMECTYIENC